jgi:hypothetical protein
VELPLQRNVRLHSSEAPQTVPWKITLLSGGRRSKRRFTLY